MIAKQENPRRKTGEVEIHAPQKYRIDRTEASREADAQRRDKVRRRIFSNVPAEFSDYRQFAPKKSVQDVRFAFQRAVLRDERLTAWERLILVFIVERFNVADRRAIATDQQVREALGIGKRTIERARAKCEELGLVWTRGGTGKGDPLVYFLRVEGLFVKGTVASPGDPQSPPGATSSSESTSEEGLREKESSTPFIVEGLRDRRPLEALEAIAQEIEAAPTSSDACNRFSAFTEAIFDLMGPRRLASAMVVDRLRRAAHVAACKPCGESIAAPARLSWLPEQFAAPKRFR